jgi:hypothetical protein
MPILNRGARSAVAVTSLLLAACSAAPSETSCSTELAIHGANDGLASMLDSVAPAIGALETSPGQVRCTGFLVAPGWVLAAKHCRGELAPLTRFVAGNGQRQAAVSFEVAHPERDLLLVRLLDVDVGGPSPIPLWPGGVDSDWLGRDVVLAGYGEDERGQRGTLRAVQEPISMITDAILTTDGAQASGACAGDSGGPLLYRDVSGELFAVGVLSRGDTDCKGLDEYTRVDDVSEWLQKVEREAQARGCSGLSEAGHCERTMAVYCRRDQPVRELCQSHQICGWSNDQQGYRCVDEDSDPCLGSAAGGKCDGNQLLTCEAGRLRRVACDGCTSCQRRPTGGARCE